MVSLQPITQTTRLEGGEIVTASTAVPLLAPIRHERMGLLAADVVGYCRLIEIDELATALRVRDLQRRLIDPLTHAHDGRLVCRAGDGAVAAFPSAVEAVRCALALRREMARQERHHAPADRLQIRLGVSAGDVLVLGADLFGKALNVAARLQAMARSGEILLSAEAFGQLEPTMAAQCADLGLRRLRKMATAVHVYHIAPYACGENAEPVEPD